MKNNFYLALAVLTPIVFGFYHASSDGVTISYKMTKQNTCLSVTSRLAQIQGLSFPDCVKECALRKSCRALHYRRRFFICNIFQSFENEDIGHGDCTFINGSDISVHTTPCGDCPYGYFCDVKSATCTTEECPVIPVLENGQTVGNMNNKASKIGFTCNLGYREKNAVAVAVCLDNGQWSETAECVKLTGDCDSPPNISNGYTIRSADTLSVICDEGYESYTITINCTHPEALQNVSCTRVDCGSPPTVVNGMVVLDNNTGHFYQDTATVVCNSSYQSNTATISCLATGAWEIPMDCIASVDCVNSTNITNGHVIQSANTLLVQCDNGYRSKNTSIACSDLEVLRNVTCTRVDCGFPPTVQNGHVVLDTSNGHFYQDTASVVCKDWYQSQTTSIKCLASGIWEDPTECIDCYPSSPWEYVGKTNLTRTGRECQRWDSQVPHHHPHTDLQYYPEKKLIDAHNYCRNPEPDYFDPWCMTMDPLVEWEFCNIKKCS